MLGRRSLFWGILCFFIWSSQTVMLEAGTGRSASRSAVSKMKQAAAKKITRNARAIGRKARALGMKVKETGTKAKEIGSRAKDSKMGKVATKMATNKASRWMGRLVMHALRGAGSGALEVMGYVGAATLNSAKVVTPGRARNPKAFVSPSQAALFERDGKFKPFFNN